MVGGDRFSGESDEKEEGEMDRKREREREREKGKRGKCHASRRVWVTIG